MKLTQNKIDEIVLEIIGDEGLRLVKALKGKENISEFTLATKLRRDIKLVRHMLYKLHNFNLVSSTRKKDKQKGWYVYYWTIIPENIKFLYLKKRSKLLEKLKIKLKKEETDHFFTCNKKCVRLDFDQSLDFEFHCPECGELVSQDKNTTRINQLMKKIEKLEKELEEEKKNKIIQLKKEAKKRELEKKKEVVKKITVKKKVIKKTSKSKTKVKKK